MTLARQRVVGVADPYRVGAYNAIIPTTHGHGTNISCIFSNSPQSIVGCGDSTHRCRRRRHRTQAGTKRIKQHKRNNKIFSDTCAPKGRRGRRPLQSRCVQCNHTDNARAQRKHSCIFSNSPQSIVGCGDSTHRCRRRRHRTQAGTKRIKQHKRNNKIFSDTCAPKGRRGRRPLQSRCVQCNHTDNARAQRKHSCIFSNSPQSIVGCGDSTHRCRRRRHRTQAPNKAN